jgi:anti-anti-sigma factor
MLFDVRTVTHGDHEVVRVVGDVDLSTIPALRSQLDRTEGPRVALDLDGVDLFDPLAFGVVIAAAMRLRRRGADLVVVCPPGRPRELFAESGVDRIVTVVDGVDALS